MNRLLLVLPALAIALSSRQVYAETDHDSKLIQSAASGLWSAGDTWEGDQVPGAGDRVLIREGHRVTYDVASEDVIRGIGISGTLTFASDRDTVLNVGLIRIESGNSYSEDGFDCRHVPEAPGEGGRDAHRTRKDSPTETRPALEIGTPESPIPSRNRATIRLHYVDGMDRETCPAIVCCGGRMDIHGAPLGRTWVKLTRTAEAGATRLFLAETVEGWNNGDRILITGTARQEPAAGTATGHVHEHPASEVRTISRSDVYDSRRRKLFDSLQVLEIDRSLDRGHRGGEEFSAEIANLSRNVVIESAAPEGIRGHTMYHRSSAGSISYAEFRHLGKKGVLGKYPIHYHLVGDTMRGSSVIGASVWDSHNRWITIHGTQYLVVRDCVGYQSLGHGYFLEDGTEVFNILDRNLAVQAFIAEPLPDQVLPFDHNAGAGFWWANSLNAFTRNVAVECDQYGFRFEAEETDEFDLVLPILQPDGSTRKTDIRTLPFICFDGNEAHSQRRFGLNLGGIRGMTYPALERYGRTGIDVSDSVGGSVDGVGPDKNHPFQIRDFKVWDTHWAFHCGSPCVSVDGMNIFDCNYGIWRSVIDLHEYSNLSFREIHSRAISFPTGGHGPDIRMEDGRPKYPATSPVDDLPPVTVVTRVKEQDDGTVHVSGVTVDNGTVSHVTVNERSIPVHQSGCSEWSADLPQDSRGDQTLVVRAEDAAGNREPRAHTIALTPAHAGSSHGGESP